MIAPEGPGSVQSVARSRIDPLVMGLYAVQPHHSNAVERKKRTVNGFPDLR